MNSSEPRILVLAAFPAECDAVLSHTTLDPDPVVVCGRRYFYLGAIGGRKVIVAMTGIGLVNAANATEAAFARFNCIGAVVFSGVAGGGSRPMIGDVAIPAQWTLDGGTTFRPVDAGMLETAQTLSVALDNTKLRRQPRLVVGGDGASSDNNNGTAFPAIPFGGSVFGCRPRRAPNRSPFYTGNFVEAIGPWLARGLIGNVRLAQQNPAFDAMDMETAAAQAVADAHGVPFLGIRGISDGQGDPLHLPGFPITFFYYKRIAADNAARTVAKFLRNWH
ncbi:5'-methylthioadenosine/S-adenosylhomocysteine nucleosidase family protein [Mycobacterium conspicuum]|uniref:5'-methylthioadenosine/S-adenosylhomocysteine nucleosidase family protein n=1 Tax=Mycobacterium conspicuum TaxID=44010 RepID=UPI001E5FA749|nr:hypothetical protein [Mycobacterium conspicuum]